MLLHSPEIKYHICFGSTRGMITSTDIKVTAITDDTITIVILSFVMNHFLEPSLSGSCNYDDSFLELRNEKCLWIKMNVCIHNSVRYILFHWCVSLFNRNPKNIPNAFIPIMVTPKFHIASSLPSSDATDKTPKSIAKHATIKSKNIAIPNLIFLILEYGYTKERNANMRIGKSKYITLSVRG